MLALDERVSEPERQLRCPGIFPALRRSPGIASLLRAAEDTFDLAEAAIAGPPLDVFVVDPPVPALRG
jgi:hypothetical protein